MQTVLLVVQLVVAVSLIITVLLQRSEGGALGMGGGGSGGLGSLFSPRGAADTLTRTTAILAVLFVLSSLALTVLALQGKPKTSILDSQPTTQQPLVPAQKPAKKDQKPLIPSVPTP